MLIISGCLRQTPVGSREISSGRTGRLWMIPRGTLEILMISRQGETRASIWLQAKAQFTTLTAKPLGPLGRTLSAWYHRPPAFEHLMNTIIQKSRWQLRFLFLILLSIEHQFLILSIYCNTTYYFVKQNILFLRNSTMQFMHCKFLIFNIVAEKIWK